MENQGIPRIIWQTHEYSWSDLPLYMQAAIGTWKEHNPDFQHRYVTGSERREFLESNFDKEFCDFYERSDSNVVRADIWRIAVMLKFGGIYADVDTYCMRPIDKFMRLDSCSFVCEKIQPASLGIDTSNSVFATVANGPEITRIYEQFRQDARESISERGRVDIPVSGPALFNKVLSEMYPTGSSKHFQISQRGFPQFDMSAPIWSYSDDNTSVLTSYGSTGWNDVSFKTPSEYPIKLLSEYISNGVELKISAKTAHHVPWPTN